MELENHHFVIFNQISNSGNDCQWLKRSNERLGEKMERMMGNFVVEGLGYHHLCHFYHFYCH